MLCFVSGVGFAADKLPLGVRRVSQPATRSPWRGTKRFAASVLLGVPLVLRQRRRPSMTRHASSAEGATHLQA